MRYPALRVEDLNRSRRTAQASLLLAAILALWVTSCGGYVTRGRKLYHEGRYIESAEVLQRHENDLRAEPPPRQAEYATYRGLSMLVLGNYPEAHRWMRFAYEVERSHPGAMQPAWRRDLDQGWKQLQLQMRVPSFPQPHAHTRRP